MADNIENINYKITVNAETGTAVVRDLKGQIIATKVPVQELRKEFGNFVTTVNSTEFKKFNSGLKNITKSKKDFSAATGSATAATMELSRVVSDAPYGIRGMANNITQLVSQLGSASVKAGGLTSALKLMWKSLMGPLGIVFAITAAVSALDYFYGANKKAEENTEGLTKSIGGQAAKLKGLKEALDSGFMSRKEANEAVVAANKEFKELNLKLDENNKLTSDSVLRLNEKTEALINVSKAQALQALLEKKYSELLPLQAKQAELDTKAKKDNEAAIRAVSSSLKEYGTAASEATARRSREAVKENKQAVIAIEKDISDLLKLSGEDGIIDLMFNGKKGKKGAKGKKISPFKVGKELELDIKSNEAALLAFGKKTELQLLKNKEVEELNSAKTEEQRNIIKKRYAKLALIAQIENERKALLLKKATEKAILQGKYDTFQKEAELRRLAYIDTINKSKLTEEQKASAIKKANADTLKLTSAAFKEQQAELGSDGTFETQWRATLAAFETLTEARLKLADVSKVEKSTFETDLEKMAAYAEAAKAILGGITEFVNGEFDRQLIIEQNKTNALNNELNERLLNENLSKDGREAIQNQIAQNDERLRVKQEKIERKRFKMQKAANIALAMVDTFRAGVGVLADTRGGTVARIAGMTAVIASGLLTVASIARQKFQSSAGSSPLAGGNAGGGSARAEPSFNIVGRSNDNLLLNAIQSQFDQPLRAYVVARDVTSQQQMDGVISGEAST